MNLVPVEDVARAHVLALARGRPGERYLLGGDNLTFAEIWATLAELCGRPAPRLRVPYGLALTLGWADELRCRARPGQEPLVPLEGVAMSRHYMFASSDKAGAELGFAPGSSRAALARAVAWFHEHGDLTRENGQRFRERLLGRGGSIESTEAYRDFRGADPDLAHLLRRIGV